MKEDVLLEGQPHPPCEGGCVTSGKPHPLYEGGCVTRGSAPPSM